MPKRLKQIPLHKQTASAIGGLEVWHLTYKDFLNFSTAYHDHRDDHYILMVLLKGKGVLRCDMENITGKAKSVVIIKPYQVHSGAEVSKDAEAYFISIAPFLMPDVCNSVFQGLTIRQQCLRIPSGQVTTILSVTKLLHKAFNGETIYKTVVTNGLFNVLAHSVAGLFSEAAKKQHKPKNQAYLITQKFKQLVIEHSFLHAPSFFSGKLNITTSHLNDCVKSTTGISVTQSLQDAMLLEAKRNLYYTNDDVKKVAFTLGFGDHAYFSRLFKKLTKETPLAFRNKFRE